MCIFSRVLQKIEQVSDTFEASYLTELTTFWKEIDDSKASAKFKALEKQFELLVHKWNDEVSRIKKSQICYFLHVLPLFMSIFRGSHQ